MKYDLVIYNAKIVTEEEVFLGYICVSDGKIAAMGSDAPVYEAAQSLDAKGMLLLPGAIDTHPHFFEPGAEARESSSLSRMCTSASSASTGMGIKRRLPVRSRGKKSCRFVVPAKTH